MLLNPAWIFAADRPGQNNSGMPVANTTNDTLADSSAVLSLQLFFHVGRSEIDPSLSGNQQSIDRFFRLLDSLSNTPYIRISPAVRIRSSASPEGSSLLNTQLSRSRGEILRFLVLQRIGSTGSAESQDPPSGRDAASVSVGQGPSASGICNALPELSFEMESVGEDWETLSRLLKSDGLPSATLRKSRHKALRIIEEMPQYIRRNGQIVGGRKKALMELDGGKFWWQIYRRYFPGLRQATLTLEYTVINPLEQLPSPASVPPAAMNTDASLAARTPAPDTSASTRETEGQPLFALKTNLLRDAVTAVNFGFEVPLGQRFSIAADLTCPWWRIPAKDITFQMMAATLEGRYWFGDRTSAAPMTGFFAGAYAGAGLFDFQLARLSSGRGVQGEFFILTGLSAGYAHKISRSLRLEYSLGLEYVQCDFREYIPAKDTKFGDIKVIPYPWTLMRSTSVLPARAAVSLVWTIGQGKGGER